MQKILLLLSIFVVKVAAVTNCAGTSLFPKALAKRCSITAGVDGCEGDNFYEAITGTNNNWWFGGIA